MSNAVNHIRRTASDPLSVFIRFQRDGVFTQTIRELFETKRISLSISFSYLSRLIGVTQQTLWNWSRGISTRCILRNRLQVLRFLTGFYDGVLEGNTISVPSNDIKNEQRALFQHVLGEVAQLYSLLFNNAGATDLFLSQLNKLISSTKRSFLTSKKHR